MDAAFSDLPGELVNVIAKDLPYPSLRSLRLTSKQASIIESKIYAEALKQMPQYLRYFDLSTDELAFIDRNGNVWYYSLLTSELVRLDGFPEPIQQVWFTAIMIYAQGKSGVIYAYNIRMESYIYFFADPIHLFVSNSELDEPFFVTKKDPNIIRNKLNNNNFGITVPISHFSGDKTNKVLIFDNNFAFGLISGNLPIKVGATDGITDVRFMFDGQHSVFSGTLNSPVIMVGHHRFSAYILTFEGLYWMRIDINEDGKLDFTSIRLFPDLRFISMHVGNHYISLITNSGYIYILHLYDPRRKHSIIQQQVVAVKTSDNTLITLDENGTFYYKNLNDGSPMIPLKL